MNPRVKKVSPQNDFKLHITFANGEEKLFDITPYLQTGVFKSLNNIAMFATAHAQYGTVVWQNNVDFDPDTLYLEGVKIINSSTFSA